MIPPGGRKGALSVIFGLSACVAGREPLAPEPCLSPIVSRTSVAAGTGNVLSGFVTARVQHTDSVAVRFGRGTALDSVTPAFPATGDSLLIPVLGLESETRYVAQLVAYNRCASAAGEVLSFTTGALPADVPRYVGSGSDPTPGYVVFAAGNYGLVIDNTGRVVWYHRFPNGPGLNFQPQPNGRYVARPNTPTGETAVWIEVDPLGVATRTLRCARGLQPRMHDMITAVDGSYWLLCDEVRTLDLSSAGGSQQAPVMGTAVQHISASGDLLFEWSPFDHLPAGPAALQVAERVGGVINWTHGNALDLDEDGNLLVSFRNLSEITKIDTRTGAVLWRMGGTSNQFSFENVAAPPFARQHGVRAAGRGRFIVLDNLGDPTASRAEHYEFDEARRVVRLVQSYVSPAAVVGQLGGNVQPLSSERILVSFGNGGAVEEFDSGGRTVWQLQGNPGYVFRAQRIRSLYRPGAGDPR